MCVSVRIRAKSKPVFFSFSSFLFIQIFLIYLFLLLFCCHSIWVRFIYCFQCLFFCEGGEKAEMDFYNADKIDQYRCCFVLFVIFFSLLDFVAILRSILRVDNVDLLWSRRVLIECMGMCASVRSTHRYYDYDMLLYPFNGFKHKNCVHYNFSYVLFRIIRI